MREPAEQAQRQRAEEAQRREAREPPEREQDRGVLHVSAHRRYEASKWTATALREYVLAGRRPQPLPSLTGLVEPAEPHKIGIACSGGGIRSAAFSLGALQALQGRDVLQQARYLAGVSGGSYIAAAFSMVRATGGGNEQAREVEDGHDDSDPQCVTDTYPPFFPGSPEEQYLRNRCSYMAPGVVGKTQLVYRVLLGMGINLVFIALALAALSAPLSLLYGWIFPALRGHLEHGGLCRAAQAASTHAARPPVLCEFTPLSLPTALWLTLAIGAGLGIVMGVASIVAYRWRPILTDITETWSLRLLVIFGTLGLALLGLPLLLSLVRGWGAATHVVEHKVHRHGSGGEGASTTATAVAGAGGVATLGAAVLLQLRAQLSDAKALASDVGATKKWYEGLTPRLRSALVYLVAAVIGPALTLAAVLETMTITLNLPHGWERALAAGGLPALFLFVYVLVDLTTWSLHSFYRRRLCSAFALKRVADPTEPAIASTPQGTPSFAPGVARERDYSQLVELSKTAVRGVDGKDPRWPTLLVCAAANISDSAATPPGRAVTSFTFSATAMGGPLVGAVPTQELEAACDKARKRYFTLPAAVAVSGAAISPSMGKLTRWPLRFLMALANVRLGIWIPNPRRIDTFRSASKAGGLERLRKHYPKPRGSYLLRELLGVNSINARYLYVTDGGHYENLGLVELLRRGCTEIYVFDASNDDFVALGDAVSLARSELEVHIEIDYKPLEVDPKTKRAETSCVTGKIVYPGENGQTGTLHYARLVMPPDASADVVAYHTKDERFPHDPTTDQLYTDQRFEAYRSLGATAANTALAKRSAPQTRDAPQPKDTREPQGTQQTQGHPSAWERLLGAATNWLERRAHS